MTMPAAPDDNAAWLADDGTDRRTALAAATEFISSGQRTHPKGETQIQDWLNLAQAAYQWLRDRDSLRPLSVRIIPGTPYPEGTTAMSTVFNLNDTDQVEFSLTGTDVKGASVPLPDGFTAAWTLADPDSSGATLTPSADNTTAVLAAGVPDTNLMVSVTVTNPDATVLNGAEAVIVVATEATTVGIVAGTPTAETPPSA